MARMYPPEAGPDVKSNAERHVFDLLKSQLGNEWTVLHSLGIAHHTTKPWAELDFVLVGPPGVICLEVKGGRVTRQDSRWGFTNRNGETSWKNQGPYEQVGGGTAALLTFLRTELPWIRSAAVMYGVVFPDVKFTETCPDILAEVTYDHSDNARPISSYIRRLTSYWHDRLESSRGAPIESLTDSQRAALVHCLRGDFDFRPSLGMRIGTALNELLQLTNEQYRVLDGLSLNDRAIIIGGAGTGKTVLAVEEARRQAENGANVLLCCSSRNLAKYLQKAVADKPSITAVHLHGLMARLVGDAQLEYRLPAAEKEDLFQVFYPELCVEALYEPEKYQPYDILIVDEAQDILLETYTEVFDALVKGGLTGGQWRLFYDPCQNIFDAVSTTGLKRFQDTRCSSYRLTLNCRNTRPVATATHLLSGAEIADTARVEGPDVEQEYYRDEAHELRLVGNTLRRLLSEGIAPSKIALLSLKRPELERLRNGIRDCTYPLVDYETEAVITGTKIISCSSVAGFKGLEADAILLLDVDDLESNEALQSLYVGASRAKAYLAAFVSERMREVYDLKAFEYGKALRNSTSRS